MATVTKNSNTCTYFKLGLIWFIAFGEIDFSKEFLSKKISAKLQNVIEKHAIYVKRLIFPYTY
jgi:hypothetical protein